MDFSMRNWPHSKSKGTDNVKLVSGAPRKDVSARRKDAGMAV